MGDGVWKGVYLQVFDPSTPSLRKVDNGEKKKKEKEKNVVFSGRFVIASS